MKIIHTGAGFAVEGADVLSLVDRDEETGAYTDYELTPAPVKHPVRLIERLAKTAAIPIEKR